jgi:hypothetical protein
VSGSFSVEGDDLVVVESILAPFHLQHDYHAAHLKILISISRTTSREGLTSFNAIKRKRRCRRKLTKTAVFILNFERKLFDS